MAEFEHLWNAPPGRFILRKFLIDGEETFLISDVQESTTLIIEDDRLLAQVARRMMDSGVEVVDQTGVAE
ncbi:hypothetical protein [Streptomyces sp. NPDC097981]|uniref:hypothetical protein n=1 Tax=Streptomyces sp. NPDC097981 TaxID=3155428 RepID=UPI00331DA957